jgi:hypothetical protein
MKDPEPNDDGPETDEESSLPEPSLPMRGLSLPIPSLASQAAIQCVKGPRFNLAAYTHTVQTKAIHDYLAQQRRRAKNRVGRKSRAINRQRSGQR